MLDFFVIISSMGKINGDGHVGLGGLTGQLVIGGRLSKSVAAA